MNCITTVHLGRISQCVDSSSRRGQLFYHHGRGLIFCPETNLGSAWRCSVVSRLDRAHPLHIEIEHDELSRSATEVVRVVPIMQPDLFALVWQAQVFVRWPWRGVTNFARVLVEDIRPSGSTVIELLPTALRTLCLRTHVTPVVVSRQFERLREAGFISGNLATLMSLRLSPRLPVAGVASVTG